MSAAPEETTPTRFELEDGGSLALYERWISAEESDRAFDELRSQTPWRAEAIRIAGRLIPVPRLTAWYGDPAAVYTYSGLRKEPLPWTPLLAHLRERIRNTAKVDFNSVLLNYYRDGNDSMGWHSDDEPELGDS